MSELCNINKIKWNNEEEKKIRSESSSIITFTTCSCIRVADCPFGIFDPTLTFDRRHHYSAVIVRPRRPMHVRAQQQSRLSPIKHYIWSITFLHTLPSHAHKIHKIQRTYCCQECTLRPWVLSIWHFAVGSRSTPADIFSLRTTRNKLKWENNRWNVLFLCLQVAFGFRSGRPSEEWNWYLNFGNAYTSIGIVWMLSTTLYRSLYDGIPAFLASTVDRMWQYEVMSIQKITSSDSHAFVSLYLDWRRSIGCVGMKVTIRVVMNEVHATIQINLILYFCNFSISFVSTCICRGTKLRCSLNDNKITKSRCLHSLSSTKFVFYFQRQREITTICYIAELKNKWMSPTTNNERITKRIIICKCQWSPLD